MRIFLIAILAQSFVLATPQEACYNACSQMMIYMNKNLDGHNVLQHEYLKTFNNCITNCEKIKN